MSFQRKDDDLITDLRKKVIESNGGRSTDTEAKRAYRNSHSGSEAFYDRGQAPYDQSGRPTAFDRDAEIQRRLLEENQKKMRQAEEQAERLRLLQLRERVTGRQNGTSAKYNQAYRNYEDAYQNAQRAYQNLWQSSMQMPRQKTQEEQYGFEPEKARTNRDYYTAHINTAIEQGDYEQASWWMDKMVSAPQSKEQRDQTARYIQDVYGNLEQQGSSEDAAKRLSEAYERDARTFADLITGDEGPALLRQIEEKYGIPAAQAYQDPDAYAAAVQKARAGDPTAETGDRAWQAYNEFAGSKQYWLTQNANNAFLKRAEDTMARAEHSQMRSAQMDSYTRAQQAVFALDQLTDRLDSEGNYGTFLFDSNGKLQDSSAQYLINELKGYGVDLTGLDASNYRELIRQAYELSGSRVQMMGDALRSDGYDVDAVRQYLEYQRDLQVGQDRNESVRNWAKEQAEASRRYRAAHDPNRVSQYDPWDPEYAGQATFDINEGFWNLVIASLGTVAENSVLSGYENIPTWARLLSGNGDVNRPNEYIPVAPQTKQSDLVRSAIGEQMSDAGQFWYNAVMSWADSTANAAMFGGVGFGGAPAMGMLGEGAGEIFTQAGTLATMGMNAATSQANEILERGGNRRQAVAGGLAAGVVETLTEIYSVENLIHLSEGLGYKQLVKELLKSFVAEGSEEVTGSVLDQLIDQMNMGNLSENSQAVRKYVAEGRSYQEAQKQVMIDNLRETLEAGLSGGLSGAFSTVAVGVPASVYQEAQAREFRAQYEPYEQLARSDTAAAAIREYAKGNQIRIRPRQLGETTAAVAGSLQQRMQGGSAAEVQAVYEQTMQQYGDGIADTAKLAAARALESQLSGTGSMDELRVAYQEISASITNDDVKEALLGACVARAAEIQARGQGAGEAGTASASVPSEPTTQVEGFGGQIARATDDGGQVARATVGPGDPAATGSGGQIARATETGDLSSGAGAPPSPQGEGFGGRVVTAPAEEEYSEIRTGGNRYGTEEGYSQAGAAVQAQGGQTGQTGTGGRFTTGRTGAEVLAERAALSAGAGGRRAGESVLGGNSSAEFRRPLDTKTLARLGQQRAALAEDSELVSSAEIIRNGSESGYVRVIPEERYDDRLRGLQDLFYAHGIPKMKAVVGLLQIDIQGTPTKVNGFIDMERGEVVIDAGSHKFSEWQIGMHELAHRLTTEETVSQFRAMLEERYKDIALQAVYNAYSRAYAEVMDAVGITDQAEREAYVWEEILADAASQRNAHGTRASLYSNEAAAALELTQASETKDAGEETEKDRENARYRYAMTGYTGDGYEVFETNSELDGLSYQEKLQIFADSFLDPNSRNFLGNTIRFERNGKLLTAEIDRFTRKENTEKINPGHLNQWDKAKINIGASGDFVTLLENSVYDREEKNRSTKKNDAHKKTDRFEYYVKTAYIDGKPYDVVANIRKENDGDRYVYDVKLKQNKELPQLGPQTKTFDRRPKAQSARLSGSSDERVTQTQREVKPESDDGLGVTNPGLGRVRERDSSTPLRSAQNDKRGGRYALDDGLGIGAEGLGRVGEENVIDLSEDQWRYTDGKNGGTEERALQKAGLRVGDKPVEEIPWYQPKDQKPIERKESQAEKDARKERNAEVKKNRKDDRRNGVPKGFESMQDYLQSAKARSEAAEAQELAHVAKEKFTGTAALQKLGIQIEDSVGIYSGVKSILENDKAAQKVRREVARAEKRLSPTDAEKDFAVGLAAGTYDMADIPDSMEAETVLELADYYYAEQITANDLIRKQKANINRQLDQFAEKLFKDSDNGKPIKSMLELNNRTPERLLRKMFGDEYGATIAKALISPVQTNESERLRFINRMFNEVRTFEDSNGKQTKLTKAERALVQMVIEGKAASEIAAGMERSQDIADAAKNIANGADAEDTFKEYSLHGEERDTANRLAVWEQAQKALASDEVDSVRVENAAKKYSELFDMMYEAINDFLVAHGYDPIGYIKGYAPHMQPEGVQKNLDKALQALGVNTDVTRLPTEIAGLTGNYKPGKRWNPYFLTRTGNTTEFDIATGFESYMDFLSDVLYHTDDILRVRAASRYFRSKYAKPEIKESLSWAQELQYGTPSQKASFLRGHGVLGKSDVVSNERINQLMDDFVAKQFESIEKLAAYGEFVSYLDNYANILAGKQSMADRGWEYSIGRKGLNIGNALMRTFGRSKVAGSLSSMLNQSAQVPAIYAELGTKWTSLAIKDMMSGELRKGSWYLESDFLTEKHGIDYIVSTTGEMVTSAMFKPAELMDTFVSTLAVRGKYLQQIKQGKSHQEAMQAADKFGREIMGSRAKGSRPLAYSSKNLISQMIHIFQVEAANSWDHVFSDLPRDFREIQRTKGKAAAIFALAGVLLKTLLASFVLNRLADELYGGTPAPFDLIGLSANFIASGKGLSTNQYIRSIIDNATEKLTGRRIFDTDAFEDDEFQWEDAFSDLGYNVMNDVPFLRNVSGVMGWGDNTMPIPRIGGGIKDIQKAVKDHGWISGETGRAALGLASEFIPGGAQLKKSLLGLETVLRGGDFSGYGENEKLKYPLEDSAWSTVRSILFGKYSTEESSAYYASDDKQLTEKQTATYQALVQSGADRKTVYDAIQDYRKIFGEEGLESYEKDQKVQKLFETLDLTEDQKLVLYGGLTGELERTAKLEDICHVGVTFDEALHAYTEYNKVAGNKSELKGYDKQKAIADVFEKLDLTDYQKLTVYHTFTGNDSRAKKFETIMDAGVSFDTALQTLVEYNRIGDDEELEGLEKGIQKRALLAGLELTDDQKLTMYREFSEANATTPDKFQAVMEEGLSFADAVSVYDQHQRIDATDAKVNEQATEYAHWLAKQGFSAKQQEAIREEFKFWGMYPGEADSYDKLIESGLSDDVAYQVTEALSKLEPPEGKDQVQSIQKWRAIIDTIKDPEKQLQALSVYMEENAAEYVRIGYNAGLPPEAYVAVSEIKPQYDADGSGGFSQEEIKNAINGYYTSLTNINGRDIEKEKAILWQLLCSSSKNSKTGKRAATWKNNPFDKTQNKSVAYAIWKLKYPND